MSELTNQQKVNILSYLEEAQRLARQPIGNGEITANEQALIGAIVKLALAISELLN